MATVQIIYRGVEINPSADVLGFRPHPGDEFCFVSHYRRDDDAPCLSFGPSVEACKTEIDALFDSAALAKAEA